MKNRPAKEIDIRDIANRLGEDYMKRRAKEMVGKRHKWPTRYPSDMGTTREPNR